MIFPIGDEPNPRQTAVVTWSLIAINLAVFLIFWLPSTWGSADLSDPLTLEYVTFLSRQSGMPVAYVLQYVSAYDVVLFKFGFRPDHPSVASLFSSLFLHASWLHLLGNMLFLWIFGDNVEARLGRVRYLLVYLFSGVVATLFFALVRLDSGAPLVGASGAISGVLGCYFVWFPRNRVRLLLLLLFFVNVIRVPARWVLGFYLLIDNVLPFLLGSQGSVAHGAHIGGFLAGMGCAWVIGRRGSAGAKSPWADKSATAAVPGLEPSRYRDGSALWSPTPLELSPKEAFASALARGDTAHALHTYAALGMLGRRGLDPEDVLALAQELTQQQRFDAALMVLQGFIAVQLDSEVLARAHLHAGLIWLRAKQRPTAAAQHFLAVLDLAPSSAVREAARQALAQATQQEQ